jgi:hypothetical protein
MICGIPPEVVARKVSAPVPRLEGHAPTAHHVRGRQLRARHVLREQLELARERLPGGGKEHVRHRRMGTTPQELVHEARLPDPPPSPHGDEAAAALLPHPAQLGLQGRNVTAPADEVAHLLILDLELPSIGIEVA